MQYESRSNCYDKATMESFWSTLKTDTGRNGAMPASRCHAELSVFAYVETFYHTMRRHGSICLLSPVACEKHHKPNGKTAA